MEDLDSGKVDEKSFAMEVFSIDCPHGRLIDADAFKTCLKENLEKFKNYPNYEKGKAIIDSFCLDIDAAPTVVGELE